MSDSDVGVAISTTRQRPEFLNAAIAAWRRVGLEPVVINDLDHKGVAVTKNRCLNLLMETGADHLFLADDDMYPLTAQSWQRYVDDPALHLSLCWGKSRDLGPSGEGHSLWSHPRGVLLYFHRSVIEKVGGYRTEYPNFHEHVDMSRRIHQAGLTAHPYMDLQQNPREWFWAADMPLSGETRIQFANRKRKHSTIRRTFAQTRQATALWESLDGDTSYVSYGGE